MGAAGTGLSGGALAIPGSALMYGGSALAASGATGFIKNFGDLSNRFARSKNLELGIKYL
jgi:hypothetical protein